VSLYVASATGTSFAGVAYTSTGSEKTILQLATTSTDRARIISISVTMNGTSSSATPAVINLRRFTGAGTGGVSLAANTGPNALDGQNPAASTTALMGPWATTDPMTSQSSSVVGSWFVPPTSGFVYQFPLGQEPVMKVSDWLGLTILAGASVNVVASITWDE
jgi:hypothetical protein